MEQYSGNNNAWRSGHADQRAGLTERIPMHPDDFNALFAWIKAKRSSEMEFERYNFEKCPDSHDFCSF